MKASGVGGLSCSASAYFRIAARCSDVTQFCPDRLDRLMREKFDDYRRIMLRAWIPSAHSSRSLRTLRGWTGRVSRREQHNDIRASALWHRQNLSCRGPPTRAHPVLVRTWLTEPISTVRPSNPHPSLCNEGSCKTPLAPQFKQSVVLSHVHS